jgi:hypothetical protein
VECGSLLVPLDYSDDKSSTISLRIVCSRFVGSGEESAAVWELSGTIFFHFFLSLSFFLSFFLSFVVICVS